MPQTVRRRLSPEDRRNQLLDCAQHIILSDGLSSLTMELLANKASVSNPLIYKYFATRLQILQELLIREYGAFRESLAEPDKSTTNYRDAVRRYVDINFRQFSNGDILGILLGQPDVRQVIHEKERPRYAPHFINEMAKEFGIRRRLAEKVVVLASGASIAAAEHYGRYGGDRETQIDQAVSFIFGGIESLLKTQSTDLKR